MLSRANKITLLILLFVLASFLLINILTPASIHYLLQNGKEPSSLSDMISCDENINLSNYKEQLELIPSPILRAFNLSGWTFEVSTVRIPSLADQHPELVGATGMTDYNNHIISVLSNISVVHEFGHFLCYFLNRPGEIEQLFEAESQSVKNVLGVYSMTNYREYFAEYFEFWNTHHDNATYLETLQKSSPQTYLYFTELENSGWVSNKSILLSVFQH